MKFKLINEPDKRYSAQQQILINRGIKEEDIYHFLNTTDEDINEPELLGEESLHRAAIALLKTIYNNNKCLVIVDCDCDGFTSAAILINYLWEIFPTWVENSLEWFIHEDKVHGLSDNYEYISKREYDLVFAPDSASNDYEFHKALREQGREIIVLDHHEAEKISENAIVINNQLSDYPNKELSGAGVTWQFCRYLDKALPQQPDYADKFLDLVALGDMADMMSLTSIETKHLILKGFRDENIKNPFISTIVEANRFSLGEHVTPMGAAFYIAPFVNAMVRSGTLEEKQLLFNSMLKYKAFEEILSTKRGHKKGETETLVTQAVRICKNVKSRQTKAQDAAIDLIENLIEENNMMEHKVLLFLVEPGQIDKNIAGLCANKIMAKYQKPCCILTEVTDDNGNISYQGSARGCDKVGINNFKDICEQTGVIEYAVGHQGAFGLGIAASQVSNFIAATDEILKEMSDEPTYYVDYIWQGSYVKQEDVLGIANLGDIWGKDMDEPFVALEKLGVTKDDVTLMSPDKRPTLKITLPNKIGIIKFGSSQEEYEQFMRRWCYIPRHCRKMQC